MIKTIFTEMMGIDYPIIAAPMFLVSYEELVVSVSEAGGLGTFPVPNYLNLSDLELALTNIKSRTSKPIGVNLQLHGRFPWQEQLSICLEKGVNFFITALGDPALVVQDIHANGGKVFASVVTSEQALKAAERGVDGLVAVGAGAGGHGGTISTLVFVPYLIKTTGLPVVAAGGIATGKQMAAALAIGACAVEIGTRFIATPEARVSPAYRVAVVEARPDDIVYTNKITGTYANWLAKSIAGIEEKPELYAQAKWRDIWSAGQSVAQVEDIRPAQEVIQQIVRDFFSTCGNMKQFID